MKRSKTIKFDHDAELVDNACGITEDIINKMNEYGERQFKEELEVNGWAISQRIERIILDVRRMLGMNIDLPITEHEVCLCFHLHMFEANINNVEKQTLEAVLSKIKENAEND